MKAVYSISNNRRICTKLTEILVTFMFELTQSNIDFGYKETDGLNGYLEVALMTKKQYIRNMLIALVVLIVIGGVLYYCDVLEGPYYVVGAIMGALLSLYSYFQKRKA